jgi:hypothetical protein
MQGKSNFYDEQEQKVIKACYLLFAIFITVHSSQKKSREEVIYRSTVQLRSKHSKIHSNSKKSRACYLFGIFLTIACSNALAFFRILFALCYLLFAIIKKNCIPAPKLSSQMQL